MNAQQLDPGVLAFARQIREVFGPGVKLYRGQKWPGGVNGGRVGR